jgi:cobalt-zinc-cadmium efflux system protein
VWAMSTTEIALTVHLVMPLERYANERTFLPDVCRELHDRFGIEHPTIQIESGGQCGTC